MKRALALPVIAALAAPAPAFAEPKPDVTIQPLTMDRLTPESALRVDVGYELWDEPPGFDSITVVSIDLGGHYVSAGGAGAYAALPLSYIGGSGGIGPLRVEDSELMIGNLELGGLYAKRFRGDLAVVVRAGLALPTAADDDDGLVSKHLQVLAAGPRYGDLVQRVPDSTWLRLGASAMGRVGALFWRGDVGVDVALDDDNARSISPVLRANLGGGVDLGAVQLMAELVSNVIDSDGDDSASTLAIGARFASGSLQPGIALVLPLGFEDNLDYLDFAIVASLAATVGR